MGCSSWFRTPSPRPWIPMAPMSIQHQLGMRSHWGIRILQRSAGGERVLIALIGLSSVKPGDFPVHRAVTDVMFSERGAWLQLLPFSLAMLSLSNTPMLLTFLE